MLIIFLIKQQYGIKEYKLTITKIILTNFKMGKYKITYNDCSHLKGAKLNENL